VLVAHGSRAVAANTAHLDMAHQLAEATGLEVRAAFLELADPLIPASIHQTIEAGASRVLVLPYFLYPGRHLTTDIPDLVAKTQEQHRDVEIVMLDGFGADPAILALLASQVSRAHDG
jgi:sirohydrochlorin ferrochelatase